MTTGGKIKVQIMCFRKRMTNEGKEKVNTYTKSQISKHFSFIFVQQRDINLLPSV
ncbi:hypothetical protein E2C01_017251 [Portunus trituberculatus]|uniref:Uncharacterized protein n=1 Tax=Portunus trituberculatus TaxID=210409 RepID=A0A5B7DT94_PORTR|nr:hypothetical protein [Portunus trituberculatus]